MKKSLKKALQVAGKGGAGLILCTFGLYGVSWLLNKGTGLLMKALTKLFTVLMGGWGTALLLVVLFIVGIIVGELIFSGSWKKLWKKKGTGEETYE